MSEASDHKTGLTDAGVGLPQSVHDFGMKIDTGEMSWKAMHVACLGEFQAGLQWVFAHGGELGLCAEVSRCPLCGGRAVRDARMCGIENLSGGSARLKAVPRRPMWVWGQHAVPEKEAGLASPVLRALGVQSLLGSQRLPCARGQGLRGCWGSRW